MTKELLALPIHPHPRCYICLSIPSILSVISAVSPFLSVLSIWAGPIAWGFSRLVPSQSGPELRAQGLGPLLPSPALLHQRSAATPNASLSPMEECSPGS